MRKALILALVMVSGFAFCGSRLHAQGAASLAVGNAGPPAQSLSLDMYANDALTGVSANGSFQPGKRSATSQAALLNATPGRATRAPLLKSAQSPVSLGVPGTGIFVPMAPCDASAPLQPKIANAPLAMRQMAQIEDASKNQGMPCMPSHLRSPLHASLDIGPMGGSGLPLSRALGAPPVIRPVGRSAVSGFSSAHSSLSGAVGGRFGQGMRAGMGSMDRASMTSMLSSFHLSAADMRRITNSSNFARIETMARKGDSEGLQKELKHSGINVPTSHLPKAPSASRSTSLEELKNIGGK